MTHRRTDVTFAQLAGIALCLVAACPAGLVGLAAWCVWLDRQEG